MQNVSLREIKEYCPSSKDNEIKFEDVVGIRDKIFTAEALMREMPQIELKVVHHFSKGVYARELIIQANVTLTGEIHKFENLNILSKGSMLVSTEEGIVKVEAPKKLVLRGDANFATGKSDLLPASYAELNKVLASMKDNPTQKWLIEGYTDNVGSNKLNLKLSGKRAQSVVDYFVSHGINKSLFATKAMGKANPVASNKTKEGRAENRRVEINPVK